MKFFASPSWRRPLMVGSVFALALAAGHIMQSVMSSPSVAFLYATAPDTPQPPRLPDAGAQDKPQLVRRDKPEHATLPQHAARSPFGFPCGPTLTASSVPGAMLEVLVSDPCHPNAPLTVRYGDLTISTTTDQFGIARKNLPAFDTTTTIVATLRGQTMQAEALTQEAHEFTHVGLVWRGPQRLFLHALEFGAAWGEGGHVWAGSPKTAERAVLGGGGYLSHVHLSQDETAEVYTFPIKRTPLSGVVRLEVVADVTEESCGIEVEARAFQTGPLGNTAFTDILLDMPPCDQVGQRVRLKNLFQDMRMAAR